MSNFQDLSCYRFAYMFYDSTFLYFIFNPCSAEPAYPACSNSIDPDQSASSEANSSGSALFAIKYVNL